MTARAYEILGIEPSASDAQVRAAYHRLAQIYHPDRYSGARADIREEAERRMMELNAAFAELSTVRPIRGARDEGVPASWRASWDKVWLQEERWQEELKRRRQEERKRRVIHQRWEQIERVARKRAEAWAADHPDSDPKPAKPASGELPRANGQSELATRLEEARRANDFKRQTREARQAAAELKKTIDLDAPEKAARPTRT
jgi:curved DNA-binding protein CbpA